MVYIASSSIMLRKYILVNSFLEEAPIVVPMTVQSDGSSSGPRRGMNAIPLHLVGLHAKSSLNFNTLKSNPLIFVGEYKHETSECGAAHQPTSITVRLIIG